MNSCRSEKHAQWICTTDNVLICKQVCTPNSSHRAVRYVCTSEKVGAPRTVALTEQLQTDTRAAGILTFKNYVVKQATENVSVFRRNKTLHNSYSTKVKVL